MKYYIAVFALVAAFPCATTLGADKPAGRGKTSVGTASWYSRTDRGVRRRTASMEIFNDRKHTCASWHLPFNTMVRVTNLLNGKSVVVRVNDRGPAKRFVRKGRIIDLTKAAFLEIADPGDGLIPIKICALNAG